MISLLSQLPSAGEVSSTCNQKISPGYALNGSRSSLTIGCSQEKTSISLLFPRSTRRTNSDFSTESHCSRISVSSALDWSFSQAAGCRNCCLSRAWLLNCSRMWLCTIAPLSSPRSCSWAPRREGALNFSWTGYIFCPPPLPSCWVSACKLHS